ncbi:MAG TPA: antibiotic biosynthesis monooxygenase [Polyangiaceae bacterium]
MAKLAIVATLDIAEGCIDRFMSLLVAHRDRCLKEEPGTLRFDVLRPEKLTNQVLLYEEYLDDAAFQVHLNGASMARLLAESANMIVQLDSVPCAVAE